jgi:Uma2 family endonuclease
VSATATAPTAIHYPDDDGLPMSDNTQQMKWIFLVYGSLIAQYRDRGDVFVAGNHLIYPVEGDNKTRQAPDVFVAIGRPKIERGSYRVWEEAGIFPQVIFEVWSPGNRYADMQAKFAFYEKYGAEEYYILYPEFPAHAEGYLRTEGKLTQVDQIDGHVSPRLGVRFLLRRGELTLFDATGRPFRSPDQLVAEREEAERAAAEERARLEEQTRRATAEAERAEQEKERAERLAARLRELGVDPDKV